MPRPSGRVNRSYESHDAELRTADSLEKIADLLEIYLKHLGIIADDESDAEPPSVAPAVATPFHIAQGDD